MKRHVFTSLDDGFDFMAREHLMFDQANRETARTIIELTLAASRATVVNYDEGNPGSSHALCIHTTLGTIWVTPTRVYVPFLLGHIDGHPSEVLTDRALIRYNLPNAAQVSLRTTETPSDMLLCPIHFIQYPKFAECGDCA